MLVLVYVTVCILEREGDKVMIERATQAPGHASLDHEYAGDEEEQEVESVYVFRYPRGSLKVTRCRFQTENPGWDSNHVLSAARLQYRITTYPFMYNIPSVVYTCFIQHGTGQILCRSTQKYLTILPQTLF